MNVLICGQVRQAEMFRRAVARFQEARATDTVNRIIFSTWAGELDQYPGMREHLKFAAVEIVETYLPNDYMKSQGNFFYQAVQAINGLERFSPDDAVFKTRGDVRINLALDFAACKAFWEQHDRENPITGGYLEHRIAVGGCAPFIPFWFEDRYFYGKCADLRKLIRISRTGDILWNPQTAIAEVRWFATLFAETFPVVRHIMRIFWMLRLYPHDPAVYQTEIVYRSIAVYHHLVETFFTMGISPDRYDSSVFEGTIEPPPAPISVADDPITAAIRAQPAYIETRQALLREGTDYLSDRETITLFREGVDRLGWDTVHIYGDFVLPPGVAPHN